jgi:hypothetical protein
MSKAYVGNPVFEFLQSRGLSVMQVLRVTDLDGSAVYQSLEGVYASIPPRVMQGLVSLGADEDKLQTAYREYRSNQRRQIMGGLPPLAEGMK